VEDSNVHVLII